MVNGSIARGARPAAADAPRVGAGRSHLSLGIAVSKIMETEGGRKPEFDARRRMPSQDPDSRGQRGLRAATTSTSTLNSGREKPWTTRSVDAGGAPVTKRSRAAM